MYAPSTLLDDAPHRAYRRLPVIRPASAALSLLLVIGLEILLVQYLAPVVRVFALATFELVRFVRTPASLGRDDFLGVPLFPLVFGTIPPLSYRTVLFWLAGSVAGIFALGSLSRVVAAPLRYLFVYNLLLLAASACYLIAFGHLG